MTTAMVLLVQVVARWVITLVVVHAHGSRVALVQLTEYMPAGSVKLPNARMVKKSLQLYNQ